MPIRTQKRLSSSGHKLEINVIKRLRWAYSVQLDLLIINENWRSKINNESLWKNFLRKE